MTGRNDALYASADYQQSILDAADRDAIISWLCWHDRNGCFSDEDFEAEGLPPMPVDIAQAIMRMKLESIARRHLASTARRHLGGQR